MIPNTFGQRAVLKLMYAALIRASDSWRGDHQHDRVQIATNLGIARRAAAGARRAHQAGRADRLTIACHQSSPQTRDLTRVVDDTSTPAHRCRYRMRPSIPLLTFKHHCVDRDRLRLSYLVRKDYARPASVAPMTSEPTPPVQPTTPMSKACRSGRCRITSNGLRSGHIGRGSRVAGTLWCPLLRWYDPCYRVT